MSAIIGVGLDGSDVITDWFSINLQLCQWTFAFAANHLLLKHVIDTISTKFNASTSAQIAANTVHTVTGPTIFTASILEYLRKRGYTNIDALRFRNEPIQLDDILILPVTSFSPENEGMGGNGTNGTYSFVRHLFLGSWHQAVTNL